MMAALLSAIGGGDVGGGGVGGGGAGGGAGGGGGPAGEAAALRFQVRELEGSMAQLEAERCALKMRSTSAEEQLSELQGAMSSNILRYQKEILRLRQQGSQRPQ